MINVSNDGNIANWQRHTKIPVSNFEYKTLSNVKPALAALRAFNNLNQSLKTRNPSYFRQRRNQNPSRQMQRSIFTDQAFLGKMEDLCKEAVMILA